MMVMMMVGFLPLCDGARQLILRNPAGAVLGKRREQFVGLTLCPTLLLDVILHFGLSHGAIAIAIHRREKRLDWRADRRTRSRTRTWRRAVIRICRLRSSGGGLLLQLHQQRKDPIAQP